MVSREFKTIIFDCDGVLLNSNQIKSRAFYDTVVGFGEKFADELLEYHRNHGGISRNKKFQYFLNNIVHSSEDNTDYSELLYKYATLVVDSLIKCEICDGLDQLRRESSDTNWLVISGGNEDEISMYLQRKG